MMRVYLCMFHILDNHINERSDGCALMNPAALRLIYVNSFSDIKNFLIFKREIE